MKTWTTLVMVAVTMATATGNEFKERAAKISKLYNTGVAAVKKGEIETASIAFNEVLKLDAKHGHARYQLAQLHANYGRAILKKRKALFKTTVLKEIDFEDAPLSEVLEGLNYMANEVSGKKFAPNFIIQDPKQTLKDVRINLKLSRIPLSVALQYALEQAGASARYDAHATVITPRARVKK